MHTLFDGDTLFALATGDRPAPDPIEQTLLMEAGADCVARAIVHALLAATSVDRTADGGVALRSWSDAFPSALGALTELIADSAAARSLALPDPASAVDCRHLVPEIHAVSRSASVRRRPHPRAGRALSTGAGTRPRGGAVR